MLACILYLVVWAASFCKSIVKIYSNDFLPGANGDVKLLKSLVVLLHIVATFKVMSLFKSILSSKNFV